MEINRLQQNQSFQPRRKKMYMASMGINFIRKSRPWVAAWWSVALPGFGHLHLGMYTKGLILMAGEIALNLLGHINGAIYYTFLGQFARASQVLNQQWTLAYCVVFAFAIFDSYRVAVELNKISWLESKQEVREFAVNSVYTMDLNAMEKRIPWVGAFWSMMLSGVGHLYNHRILVGFVLMGWMIVIDWFAKLPLGVIYSFTGQFGRISELGVNYEWALFFPSVFCFGILDAYSLTVTMNTLFKEEQVYYLKNKYGNNPITVI